MTGNEDMIRLVPALPELLRVAEPARVSTLDVSGDRNIIAWHYLKAIADVDGRPVPVTMAVREKKDGSFHYSMVAKREEAAGGGGFSSPEGAGKPEGLSAESPSRDVLNIVPESQVDKTELTQMRAELDAADARVKDAQAAAGCAMGGAL
jgi:hypothetical protein